MGRPREFDEERALQGAMFAFWQRGYAATSLSDLEEATGLKRQSLYNAFGDKKELYGRTLEHYAAQSYQLLAPLREETAGLDELRESLKTLLGLQTSSGCAGCMIIKAAFDRQVDDPAIVEAVTRSSACVRRHYGEVLARAQERGEIDPNADPTTLANYLFTVSNGLSALAQTGVTNGEIERSLELAFETVSKVGVSSGRRRARHRRK